MGYLLPRAFIVLMGWGMTCALIFNIRRNVDPQIFYIAGVAWALAGIAGFGYLHRLRRTTHEHDGSAVGAPNTPN
jgi:hypothetical protein